MFTATLATIIQRWANRNIQITAIEKNVPFQNIFPKTLLTEGSRVNNCLNSQCPTRVPVFVTRRFRIVVVAGDWRRVRRTKIIKNDVIRFNTPHKSEGSKVRESEGSRVQRFVSQKKVIQFERKGSLVRRSTIPKS